MATHAEIKRLADWCDSSAEFLREKINERDVSGLGFDDEEEAEDFAQNLEDISEVLEEVLDTTGPRLASYADYSWIKVKRFVENPNANPGSADSVAEEYARLMAHHEEETAFLINEVKKLAALLDAAEKKSTE